MSQSNIKYRADIDGLRAIAVIAVILFHADFRVFSGGFIGVDVFFVISGFLITSILLKSLNNNNFSIITFYERRIRRIFPALFSVLLVTTIVATIIMMPQEYARFGLSLASTATFASNVLFWRESGYFDLGHSLKPLLHTWSIAVEEQFYVFFPLYLFAIYKWARKLLIPLTILGLLFSFGLSIWTLSINKPIPTFFLLPTRAWELLVGSILAFGFLPTVNNKTILNALALIGAGLVLIPIFIFTHSTAFPGPNAAYPVIGTALLIYAGLGTNDLPLLNRFLSLRPMVFMGKISYSLYLWHWPVLMFSGYILMREFEFFEKIGLIALSFIIAAASWKYIEEPFRQHGKSYNKKYVFGGAFIVSAVSILVGLFIYSTNGIPHRYSQKIQDLTVVGKGIESPQVYQSIKGTKILGAPEGKPSFIVWGDSHANAVAPAISKTATALNLNGFQLKLAGCMPAFYITGAQLSNDCATFNKSAKKVLLSSEAETVFLISRWSAYPRWLSKTSAAKGTKESRALFEKLLTDTIIELKERGKKIYLVAEVPKTNKTSTPSYLGRKTMLGQGIMEQTSKQVYLEQQNHLFPIFERLKRTQGLKIIYPHKTMCKQDNCAILKDGKSLYYDSDHLSTYGAKEVSGIFKGTL